MVSKTVINVRVVAILFINLFVHAVVTTLTLITVLLTTYVCQGFSRMSPPPRGGIPLTRIYEGTINEWK